MNVIFHTSYFLFGLLGGILIANYTEERKPPQSWHRYWVSKSEPNHLWVSDNTALKDAYGNFIIETKAPYCFSGQPGDKVKILINPYQVEVRVVGQ